MSSTDAPLNPNPVARKRLTIADSVAQTALEEREALSHSASVAGLMSPSKVADAGNLGEMFGVDPSVYMDPTPEPPQNGPLSEDELFALNRKSPGMGLWLSDPRNLALVKDDMPALHRIADAIGSSYHTDFAEELADSTDLGMKRLQAMFKAARGAGAGAESRDQMIQEYAELYGEIMRGQAKQQPYSAEAEADAAAAREAETNLFRFAKGKTPIEYLAATVLAGTVKAHQIVTNPRAYLRASAEQLPYSLPAMALGTAGIPLGPAGVAVGVTAGSYGTEYAAWIDEAIQNRLASEGKAPNDVAAITAIFNDTAWMTTTVEQAAKKAAGTSLVEGATALLPAAAVKLGRPVGMSWKANLGRLAREGVRATTVEAVLEGGGELTGRALAKGGLAPEDIPEGIEEAAMAPGTGGIVKVGTVSLARALGTSKAGLFAVAGRIARAKQDGQAVTQTAEQVKTSKALQRFPTATRSLVKRLLEGRGIGDVQIPKVEFDAVFSGEEGMTPARAATDLAEDGAERYAKAGQSQFVSLPGERLIEKLYGTPAWDRLFPNMRWHPDGLTALQAEEQEQRIKEATQKAAEGVQEHNELLQERTELENQAAALAREADAAAAAEAAQPGAPPGGAAVLQPTTEWQEVPNGTVLPPGTEVEAGLGEETQRVKLTPEAVLELAGKTYGHGELVEAPAPTPNMGARWPSVEEMTAWKAEQIEMGFTEEEVEAAVDEARRYGVNPTRSDDLNSLDEFLTGIDKSFQEDVREPRRLGLTPAEAPSEGMEPSVGTDVPRETSVAPAAQPEGEGAGPAVAPQAELTGAPSAAGATRLAAINKRLAEINARLIELEQPPAAPGVDPKAIARNIEKMTAGMIAAGRPPKKARLYATLLVNGLSVIGRRWVTPEHPTGRTVDELLSLFPLEFLYAPTRVAKEAALEKRARARGKPGGKPAPAQEPTGPGSTPPAQPGVAQPPDEDLAGPGKPGLVPMPVAGPTAAAAVEYVSPRERKLTTDEAARRDIAIKLRDADPAAVEQAAKAMAPLVGADAVLVPVPDSQGSTGANRALASAIAALTGDSTVSDVLGRAAPVESSAERRRRGLRGLSETEHGIVAKGDIPAGRLVLIDNVRTTGATTRAAQAALGRPADVVTYAQAREVTAAAPREPLPPIQAVEGRETTIHTVGQTYPARFALVELADLIPSHVTKKKATGVQKFTPDPRYPEGLQPRKYEAREEEAEKVERFARELPDKAALFLGTGATTTDGPPVVSRSGVVINGNGRAMALRLAKPKALGVYVDRLIADASQYGIEQRDIVRMDKPVLVRMVDLSETSPEAAVFAREGNEALTQAQSTADRMDALRRVMPLEALLLDVPEDTTLPEVLSGGSAKARALLDRIYTGLPENLRPAFFTEPGLLSDAGKDAVAKLMLGSVVDIDLAEAQRPAVRAMLTKAIPQLAAMHGELVPALNLRAALEAALRFGQGQLKGFTLPIESPQTDFGFDARPEQVLASLPPEQQFLVRYLSENVTKDTALRKLIGAYVVHARGSAVLGQAGITPIEGLETAAKGLEKKAEPPPTELFQAAGPRLSALHNLTAENLAHADKMGGLAMPSLAVLPEAQAMTEKMGEITLIGTEALANPEKVPVFDADIYSPRWPQPDYERPDVGGLRLLLERLRYFGRKFGEPEAEARLSQAFESPRPDRIVSEVTQSTAAKALFLDERMVGVAPVSKVVGVQDLRQPAAAMPAVQSFVREHPEIVDARPGEPLWSEFSQALRTALDEYLASKKELRKATRDKLRQTTVEYLFDENGEALFGRAWQVIEDARRAGTTELDRPATTEAVDKALVGREAEFAQWVEDTLTPLFGEPSLRIGRERRPYSLPNIVEKMKEEQLQAGEQTMTFGEGKARASAASQFADLTHMRNAAYQIASEQVVDAAREKAKAALTDWRSNVIGYHGSTHPVTGQGIDTWEALDSSMRAMARWAKGGLRRGFTAKALAEVLRSEGFRSVPAGVIQEGVDAGKLWLDAPVPYFEAKPQRAVELSEFTGAAIPKSATPQTREILAKHGIQVAEYGPAEGERAKAVAALRTRLSEAGGMELFQTAFHGTDDRLFERFSLEHVGTGEGAQAFGWGLYFSSKRAVAEAYREKSTSNVRFKALSEEENRKLPDWIGRQIAQAWRGGVEEQEIDGMIEEFRNRISVEEAAKKDSLQPWLSDDRVLGFEEIIGLLEKLKGRGKEFVRGGRLYTVELAPQDDEWLDWDKPLSQQSEKVQAGLLRVLGAFPYKPTTDGQLMARAKQYFESQRSSDDYAEDIGMREAVMAGFEAYKAGPDALRKWLHREGTSSWVSNRIAGPYFMREVARTGTGSEIYYALSRQLGGPESASKALAAAGIPGIKYLDQGSRGAIEGWAVTWANGAKSQTYQTEEYARGVAETYKAERGGSYTLSKEGAPTFNYVIFDDKLIKIVELEQAAPEESPLRRDLMRKLGSHEQFPGYLYVGGELIEVRGDNMQSHSGWLWENKDEAERLIGRPIDESADPEDILDALIERDDAAAVAISGDAMVVTASSFAAAQMAAEAAANEYGDTTGKKIKTVGFSDRATYDIVVPLADFLGARDKNALRKMAREFMQEQDAGEGEGKKKAPRGGLTLPTADLPVFTLTFYRDADDSTFAHELTHYFMHILGAVAESDDAPQQLKEDWQTLLKDVGAKDLASMTREQHEKLAAYGEQYHFEGKAPSAAMRRIMAALSEFMKATYKAVKGLGIEINPKIRQVYDRLLASDEEIAAAQAEGGSGPLLTEADFETPEEFAAYNAKMQEVTDRATERLNAQLLADQSKLRREQRRQREEQMKAEVAKTLAQRPERIAATMLIDGKMPDGSPHPTLQPFKIDRAGAVDALGKLVAGRLDKLGVLTDSGGVSPQAAAAALGAKAADELAAWVLGAADPERLIARIVREQMRQQHPELMPASQRHNAARHHLQGPELSEALYEELRALTMKDRRARGVAERRAERAEKEVAKGKAAAKQAKKERRAALAAMPKLQDIRATARGMVESVPIGRLVPWTYLRSAGALSTQAAKLDAAGKTTEAVTAKYGEILNREAYRIALGMQRDNQQGRNFLARMGRTKNVHALNQAEEHFSFGDQMAALLERFGLANLSEAARKRKTSLAKWLERVNAGDSDIKVADWLLNEDRRQRWDTLNTAEFSDLVEAAQQIMHAAWRQNRLLHDEREGALHLAEDEMAAAVIASKPPVPRLNDEPTYLEQKLQDARDRVDEGTRAQTFARLFDGGVDGGPWDRHWMRGLFDGADVESVRMPDSYQEYLGLYKKHYTRKERHQLRKPITVAGQRMNKDQVLAAASLAGSVTGRQRILQRFGPEGLAEILSLLSSKDVAFINDRFDWFDKWFPEIQEQARKFRGIEVKKVEPEPYEVETTDGETLTIKGGYYTIAYNDPKAKAQTDEQAFLEVRQGIPSSKMTQHGYEQTRLPEVDRDIDLSRAVILHHIYEVVHDLSLRAPLVDAWRLLHRPKVRNAITQHYGGEALSTLETYLKRVGSGNAQGRSPTTRLLAALRYSAVVASLGFRPVSALKQLQGLRVSAVDIGPKWVLQAIPEAFKPSTVAWMMQGSQMMRSRLRGGWYREVNELRSRMPTDLRTPVVEAAFYLITRVQFAVDTVTWLAQYSKSSAELNGTTDDVDAIDREARARADAAVRRTQGGGHPVDLSNFETADPWMRLFTTFFTDASLKLQQARLQHAKMAKNNPAEWGRFIAQMATIVVLPAVLTAIGYSLFSDDDDDETFLGAVAKGTVREIMDVGPIARQVSGGVEAIVERIVEGTGDTRDYRGPPGLQIVPAFTDAAQQAAGKTPVDAAAWRSYLLLAGLSTGLPVKAGLEAFEAAEDIVEGEFPGGLVGYRRRRR